MILETCLIFEIEKKKTKKLFFCGKNRVNPLRKEKKTKKLFFCGKTAVNPLRKKKRAGKTQITLLGHAPKFRNARENACPMEGEVYCSS
jgi:hypothetical protein